MPFYFGRAVFIRICLENKFSIYFEQSAYSIKLLPPSPFAPPSHWPPLSYWPAIGRPTGALISQEKKIDEATDEGGQLTASEHRDKSNLHSASTSALQRLWKLKTETETETETSRTSDLSKFSSLIKSTSPHG